MSLFPSPSVSRLHVFLARYENTTPCCEIDVQPVDHKHEVVLIIVVCVSVVTLVHTLECSRNQNIRYNDVLSRMEYSIEGSHLFNSSNLSRICGERNKVSN